MDKEFLVKKLDNLNFSQKIISAFKKVPREEFVPKEFKHQSYEDIALPIGNKQTISQPYTIAVMLEELKLEPKQKVLELGSGIGYVLALISEIVEEEGQVYGVEIIEEIAEKSKRYLKKYKNIEIYNKNGTKGLPQKASFDRVIMSAACSQIPNEIIAQIREGGLIVAPIGSSFSQNIITLKKENEELIVEQERQGFVFVPFVEK